MSVPQVLLTAALPAEQRTRLAAVASVTAWQEVHDPSPADLIEIVPEMDGLLTVLSDPVDASVIAAARRLRVVANRAVGYDNVDVGALTARRVPLGNTPGVLTEATADLTMALILAVARRIVATATAARAGEWQSTWDRTSPYGFALTEPGIELHGQTLGIVGLGRIGTAVAARATGFGMRVVAFSPREVSGVERVTLDDLLRSCDVVSLNVPLSETTRHLIGARELALMRRDAILVNTARGDVVDQDALVDALRSGQLAGAGLDVTTPEPLPAEHPLLGFPQCVVLPHIGSVTFRARQRMAELAVDTLLAGLAGQPLPHCVNPEVYQT